MQQLLCIRFSVIVYSLLMMSWTGPESIILARQADTLSEDQKLAKIVEASKVEAQKLVKQHVRIKIDFYQRYFDLKETQLKKAHIFSKQVSAKHARKFHEGLEDSIQQLVNQPNGNAFLVNGTTYHYDETQQSDDDDLKNCLNVKLDLQKNGVTMLVIIRSNFSSMARRIVNSDNAPLEFEKSSNWQKSLKFLDANDLQNAEQYLTDLKKDSLLNAYQLLLTERLDLSEKQQELIRPWIEENVEIDDDKTFAQLFSAGMNSRRIFTNIPDFLNKDQKKHWEQLRTDAYPGAW